MDGGATSASVRPRECSPIWKRGSAEDCVCIFGGSGRTGTIASRSCAVEALQSSLPRLLLVRRRASGVCQDTRHFRRHQGGTTKPFNGAQTAAIALGWPHGARDHEAYGAAFAAFQRVSPGLTSKMRQRRSPTQSRTRVPTIVSGSGPVWRAKAVYSNARPHSTSAMAEVPR